MEFHRALAWPSATAARLVKRGHRIDGLLKHL
jgi:hypothetical protein